MFVPRALDWMDHMMAELHDGSAFVSFRINSGNPTETFNNQIERSSLQRQTQWCFCAARDIRYSLAEGNIIGGVQQAMVQVLKTLFLAHLIQ